MLYPHNLLYSTRHVWVDLNENESTAIVGITDDLQEDLPEILSIDMPMVGDELEMDNECLHLHLPTDIRDVLAPLTGRILEINRDVLDHPHLLHVAPYSNWLFKMEYDEPDEAEMLLDADGYVRFLDLL